LAEQVVVNQRVIDSIPIGGAMAQLHVTL
jgi:hypothetical protein